MQLLMLILFYFQCIDYNCCLRRCSANFFRMFAKDWRGKYSCIVCLLSKKKVDLSVAAA